jgi:hypothetical protein
MKRTKSQELRTKSVLRWLSACLAGGLCNERDADYVDYTDFEICLEGFRLWFRM